jgi:hypothetical protein
MIFQRLIPSHTGIILEMAAQDALHLNLSGASQIFMMEELESRPGINQHCIRFRLSFLAEIA